MNTEQHPSARVAHRFSASAERVFDAWLDPAMIGNWMFGPNVREEEVLHIKADPKVGGWFSFLVRRGTDEIDHVGQYLEIDRPRRIAFTWSIAPEPPDSSRVVVEIQPLETGCEVTVTHEMQPEWADFVDRSADAWKKMMVSLGRALE